MGLRESQGSLGTLREHELKMCKNKKQYRSPVRAEVAALYSCIKFDKPMRKYQCPYCKLWHTTSQYIPEFK